MRLVLSRGGPGSLTQLSACTCRWRTTGVVMSQRLWSPVSCSDRLRCTSTSFPLPSDSLPIGPKTRASHKACNSVPEVRCLEHAGVLYNRASVTCMVASGPRRIRCSSSPPSCTTVTSSALGLSAPSPENLTDRGLVGTLAGVGRIALLIRLSIAINEEGSFQILGQLEEDSFIPRKNSQLINGENRMQLLARGDGVQLQRGSHRGGPAFHVVSPLIMNSVFIAKQRAQP